MAPRAVQVVVELADLDVVRQCLGRGAPVPEGTLARAGRLSSPLARARYLAAQRLLVSRLAAVLEQPASEIALTRDSQGSQALAPRPGSASGRPEVEFDLACRGRWCVTAFSTDGPVGVDVEPLAWRSGATALVEQLFPDEGRATLARCSPHDRSRLLATWWARVEASVRACGASLDDAADCLDLAPQRVQEAPGELVVAVAALGADELEVSWALPRPSHPGTPR